MTDLDDFFNMIWNAKEKSDVAKQLLNSKRPLIVALITHRNKTTIKFLKHSNQKLDNSKQTKAELQGIGVNIKKALQHYHKKKAGEQYICDELESLHYESDYMGDAEDTKGWAEALPNIPTPDISDFDIIDDLNSCHVQLFN